MRAAPLLVLATFLLAACGQGSASILSPTPAVSAHATATPTATAEPAASSGVGLIPPIAGFTVREAPDTDLDSFVAAANASVEGLGSLGDAVAATVEREGQPPVRAFAFTLEPSAGRTEQELLAGIMAGMASGLGAQWEPATSRQGFSIQAQGNVAFMTILADEPFALFLFVTGADGAPVDEVVTGILEAYS